MLAETDGAAAVPRLAATGQEVMPPALLREVDMAREFDRIMARLSWLAVVCLFAAAPAAAEIFKCSDKNGMDRYQNFPCPMDSIGSQPTRTSTATASQRTPTPSAMPVPFAAAGKPAKATEPRIGMSEDEVRQIWGEPSEIEQDEPKDGRIEIWRYGDGRFVQFSNRHRALVVQR
jgi:hypothetical protein